MVTMTNSPAHIDSSISKLHEMLGALTLERDAIMLSIVEQVGKGARADEQLKRLTGIDQQIRRALAQLETMVHMQYR